jgi:hypothetical protein
MGIKGVLGIWFDCAIFADTQEEPQAVYRHLEWLQSLEGPPILIRTAGRLGDHLKGGRGHRRFASIPAFLTSTPGQAAEGLSHRECSKEYKVEVIDRAIRREVLGLRPRQRMPKNAVTQYVGISLDEAGRFERIKRMRMAQGSLFRAPLVEQHMTRIDCLDWLREVAMVPHEVPRSACVFCPYHSDAEWLKVKAVPADWARAVEIDEALRVEGYVANQQMDKKMYVHSSCQPLVQIEFKKPVAVVQSTLGFWRNGFNRECMGACGL